MRIAVTGGAGRLGRSVVQTLREGGHDVLSVDLDEHADVRVDLTDREATAAAFRAADLDALVHLAAIAVPFSAPEYVIFETNTRLAFSTLEAAVAAGVGHVLVASSPTVLGYGIPSWVPSYLPIDERIEPAPRHAYGVSKVSVEQIVRMFARTHESVRFALFRPCFVLAPEEWLGAPTQQGHTILERLESPELAAPALFNYVDARDAAGFVAAWLATPNSPSGECYFVGATDALAVEPLATLLPRHMPALAHLALSIEGSASAFSSALAFDHLGWRATRSWRTELDPVDVARLTGA